MIFRRYGTTVQSVDLNFDRRALTEIAFRRNGERSLDADEFAGTHEKLEEHELTAESESSVQDEGEAELLEELEARIREIEEGLGDGEILLVENTQDDYPKTRETRREVIVEGRNRLHFQWRVDPPLRVGVYRTVDG